MRILILITLALMMLAPMADANGDHHELHVEMLDDFSFTINGESGNPDLELVPGETYLVNVTNMGATGHNFNLDLTGGSEADASSDSETGGNCCVGGGESVEFEITVPADASGNRDYWCDPHRDAGMGGTITFADAEGEDNGAPGPGIVTVAAVLGIGALLVRRR